MLSLAGPSCSSNYWVKRGRLSRDSHIGNCTQVITCVIAPYAAVAAEPSRLTNPSSTISAIAMVSMFRAVGRPIHRIVRAIEGPIAATRSMHIVLRAVILIGVVGMTSGAGAAPQHVHYVGRRVPVTTVSYRTPQWYAPRWPAPLAQATLHVDTGRSASPLCSLGSVRVTPVIVTRTWVEVASGIAVVDSTERDLSPKREIVCWTATTTMRAYDVTTGSLRSTVVDSTTMHRVAAR